jgi:hypothetical protein
MPAVSVLAVAAMLLLTAGQAQAATVYPAGGSTFTGGSEGWHTAEAPTCNIGLLPLCSASGEYDGGSGNPAGSLKAETKITLNAGGLFKSMVVLESPNFTATEGGAASLRLERELVSGSLLDLAPEVTYKASLVDRTSGTSSEVIADTVSGSEEAFKGKNGAATLVAGHTYAISVSAETNSTLVNVGLLGSTAFRLDNVALTVGSSGAGGGNNGGKGGGGGNGAGGLSDSRLTSLIQSSLPTSAVLKGNRLFVKVKCPAKIGRACHISGQGLLTKRKAATTKRTVKIARGKAKQIVLKVKPAAKQKVAKAKRILFRETVKAGSATATAYSHLKLIRR